MTAERPGPLRWMSRLRDPEHRPPELKPIDVGLGLVLATFASTSTLRCWPSIATLAASSGRDRTAVMRSMDRLDAAGVISRTERGCRSTVYELLDWPANDSKRSQKATSDRSGRATTPDADRSQKATSTGGAEQPLLVAESDPNSLRNSSGNSSTSSGSSDGSAVQENDDVDVRTQSVDGFKEPVPIWVRDGRLTEAIIAWAIEHNLAVQKFRTPLEEARLSVETYAGVLGQKGKGETAAVTIAVEYLADGFGADVSEPAERALRQLVREDGPTSTIDALNLALSQGAGVDRDDPTKAVVGYAAAILRERRSAA